MDRMRLNYGSWRKRCTQAGVLISSKEAQEAATARQSPSLRSIADSGVSLAWLQAFADVLAKEDVTGELPTAGVVAKLVAPCTTVRFPAPSAADAAQAAAAAAGQPQQAFLGDATTGAGAGQQGGNGRESASNSRLPLEGPRELHVPLHQLIPPHHRGPPHYFIIHAWSASCLPFLNAIIARLVAQNGGAATPSTLESTFVWIDWVALQQQAWVLPPGCTSASTPYSTGPQPQYWGPPLGYVDVVGARDIMAHCPNGSLLVLDCDMAVLARLWPLYEAWATTYFSTNKPDGSGGVMNLLLVLTSDMRSQSLLTLRNMCDHLDLTRAECSRVEDKQRIIAEIKASAGLKRMQQSLGETLLTSVRSYLRWCGGLEELSLFVALLLQSGDYAQLQHLLHSLPGLADDENTLNEIRAIFAMFDADGTGELEEDEFAAVLALAGFGEEEAHRIFSTVDADGGGSVGLEEFEVWWVESQRQQSASCRPSVQLTQGGLLANLRALSAMLERRELPAQATLISQHADSLEATGICGSRSPDAVLPSYTMHGDYLAVADQVVFKIMSGDLRTALRQVLELLHLNSDALALEAPPDQLLPSAMSLATMPVAVQRYALAWTMGLVAELLGRNPGRLREAEHFANEALELAAQGAHLDNIAAQRLPIKKKKKKPKKPVTQDRKARDAIVTSMVRLKYGKESLISHRLIAEASISLSTWMAGNKNTASHKFLKNAGEASGAKKKSAAVGGVNDFASSYLGAGQKSADQGNTAKEHRLPMPLADIARNLYASYQLAVEHYVREAEISALEVRPSVQPPPVIKEEDEDPLLWDPPAVAAAANAPTPSPHPDASPPSPTAPLSPTPAQQQAGKQGPCWNPSLSPNPRARCAGVPLSAAQAAQIAEPDDFGIEHLTLFAKSVRAQSRNEATPSTSPFVQLGARLERVRERQANRQVRRPSHCSSPILTSNMLPAHINSCERGSSFSSCPTSPLLKQMTPAPQQQGGERALLSLVSYKDNHNNRAGALSRSLSRGAVRPSPVEQTQEQQWPSMPSAFGAQPARTPSPGPRPRPEARAMRSLMGLRPDSRVDGKILPSGIAGLNMGADPRAAKLTMLGLPNTHLPPINPLRV